MEIVNLKDRLEYKDRLAGWHHIEWGYLYEDGSIDKRVKRLDSHLEDQFIPSTFLIFDGDLKGSASIVESDMEIFKEFTPWLASVYIEESSRGLGYGSKVVKGVMDKARECGVNKLYLFTPDQERFYEKLGWKIYKQMEYKGKNISIMSVEL